MAKLSKEQVMTISVLSEKGVANREAARLLGVSEGTIRYHRRRQAAGAADGRRGRPMLAASFAEAIAAYLAGRGLEAPDNTADLHAWLVAEHDYPGSLRSVQRYVARQYPPPPKRARRRIETPPGAQAQADWAHFPGIWLGGRQRELLAFLLQLSYSRFDALIWAERKHLMSWIAVHNAAFERLGGIPATVRVDNEKTAVVHGAGAWGTLHPVYRRYAETLHFHVDACAPRAPQAKGKVERRVRARRGDLDPYRQHWRDINELQAMTDERVLAQSQTRRCPATGGSVAAAWQQERQYLAPITVLPAPFDVVVERTVGADATLQFEGRTYSVPFALLGRRLEVRGDATEVQVFDGSALVARHPRGTQRRVVLDPEHYEGPSTETVRAPTPLGRMGRKLEAIAAMAPERRPLDLYAALAEVAR